MWRQFEPSLPIAPENCLLRSIEREVSPSSLPPLGARGRRSASSALIRPTADRTPREIGILADRRGRRIIAAILKLPGETIRMNPDRPESDVPATELAKTVSDPQDSAAAEHALSDPASLVKRMVQAGEWPEPDLIEQIARAGESAVEPLIKVLHRFPRGWPEEAPFSLAVGLLSVIRSPAAIPELIEVIKRYGGDSGQEAAEALGRFGAVAFEPVLEACRNPEITGNSRTHACNAAIYTAGDDPSRRARVADVLRPMLADAIDRFRLALRAQQAAARNEPEDETPEDEYEEEQGASSEADRESDSDPIEAESAEAEAKRENELDLYGEIFYLVNDLAALADPKAQNLIKTAFDEDMVERFFLNEEAVEARYRLGGDSAQLVPDWLAHYRESYQSHIEDLSRPAISPSVRKPIQSNRSAEPNEPSPLPVETIRNKVPNVGRNDPCWCGSGKKYKKCHLGKDVRS